MEALHYLKYTRNLSDDNLVEAWGENPYWQFFSGMQWFEHTLPIHSRALRWRKRIGDAGAEQLLQETIQAGLKLNAVKAFQLRLFQRYIKCCRSELRQADQVAGRLFTLYFFLVF